jgi:hypothetical protein
MRGSACTRSDVTNPRAQRAACRITVPDRCAQRVAKSGVHIRFHLLTFRELLSVRPHASSRQPMKDPHPGGIMNDAIH